MKPYSSSNRLAAFRSILPVRAAFFGLLLCVAGGLAMPAHAQGVVMVSPAQPAAGAAVNLGSFVALAHTDSVLQFKLSAAAQIQSVSFDPAEGGVQEMTVVSVTGCAVGPSVGVTAATATCTVLYEVNPVYAGARSGTLRVVTSTGNYPVGVSFTFTGPQPAFTPGTISSIPLANAGSSRSAIALDAQGDLYVADASAFEVEKINATTSASSIVAGNGSYGDTGDNGPATDAALGPVYSAAFSPAGDLYVVSDDSAGITLDAVRKVQGGTGIITTVGSIPSSGDYGSVVVDAAGNIYTSSIDDAYILQQTPQGGSNFLVDTGNGHNPGACSYAKPITPSTMALDGVGTLYFVANANAVYKVTTSPTATCPPLTLVAGTGTAGYSGDGGAATLATFGTITGLAVDAAGDVYIADSTNNVIRVVDASTGFVSTIAGSGTAGDSGDGGPATAASLQGFGSGALESLAIDPLGNLYVLDAVDNVVRKINVTAGALNFASTNIGSTSVDSPQTLVLSNIGNAPLVFIAPPTGPNPAITGDFSLGTSGTCQAPAAASGSLAAGTSCTELVSFTPTSDGNLTGTLTFTDTDNAGTGNNTQTATLNGTGTGTLPDAFVAPNVIGFGNTQLGTTANAWTATLNNISSTPLTIHSISIDNPVFSFTTNCGSVLPANSTCELYVTFTPTAGGQVTGTLTVNANALHGSPTIALSGYGGGSQVTLSPTSINFGSVTPGTIGSTWTVAVNNIGSSPIYIASWVLSDTSDFRLSGNCPATLAAYTTCDLTVTFTPQSAGTFNGTLAITDSASPSTQYVSLTGVGTAAATVLVSPTNINFSSVPQGTVGNPWTVNVSNTSSTPVYIASWTLSDTADFRLSGNCPATLAANSSCSLYVSFAPQSAGNFNATLTITDSASSSTQTVALSGSSTSNAPQAFVSPNNIGFGSVLVGTKANPWTVTLNNTSAFPLQISSEVMSNPVFTYTQNCGTTLPANSTCDLYIGFAPGAVGQVNGTFTINDNAQGGPQVITLSGYGQSAGVTVSLAPSYVDFSNQTVGSTGNPWTLTFNNMGGTAVSIGSISVSDTKDFSQTNYCGTSLAAYSTCNILVYFTPQSAGTLNANLVVTSNGNPATLSVPLTGTATSPAISGSYSVTVNPQSMSLAAGQTGQATFTFAPTGGYNGSVTFGCAGLPSGATCKFSPATLTANGSNTVQTSMLTVSTSGINAGTLAMNRSGGDRSMLAGLLGVNSLIAACFLLPRRRKLSRKLQTLVVLLVLVGLAGAVGCGTSTGSVSTTPGTAAVTVTATGTSTSGTVVQSTNFTLTITE